MCAKPCCPSRARDIAEVHVEVKCVLGVKVEVKCVLGVKVEVKCVLGVKVEESVFWVSRKRAVKLYKHTVLS